MNDTKKTPSNLILVGFMGTGKSTIGKFSARSLGFEFIDTDDVIIEMAGKSIPEIFEQDGEEAFREIEIEALKKCADLEKKVIATGGGIVTRDVNRAALKQAGYVVWLKAKPETIFNRVKRNHNRPLLETDDPLETIRSMLEERDCFYSDTADMEIDTSDLTVDEIVHGVTECALVAFRSD